MSENGITRITGRIETDNIISPQIDNINEKNTEQDTRLNTIETDLSNCAKITTEEQYNQKTLHIGDGFIRVNQNGADYDIDIGAGTKTVFSSIDRQNIDNYIYDNLDVNGNLNVKNELTINHVNIFEMIYPPGSIHMSLNPYPPLFGTWELISDGYFLQSTTTSPGETGGSATHTHKTSGHVLTVGEMPVHKHTFYGNPITGSMNHVVRHYTDDNDKFSAYGCFTKSTLGGSMTWRGTDGNGGRIGVRFNATPSGSISDEGNNQAHTHGDTEAEYHIPPYIKCYMYKRTA